MAASLRSALGPALRLWLPAAAAATVLAGAGYAMVQQDLRTGADDPQVQMAEDFASRLDQGAPPSAVVGTGYVDMSRSLAAFTIVYDASGTPLASGALLDGRVPVPPAGVFAQVRSGGEDRFTWQPRTGVRSAAVVTRFGGGFVLAARSLREVEQREAAVEALAALGWLAALAAAALAALAAGLLAGPGRSAAANHS